MAAGHIQLATDGAGKSTDTETLTSTEAGTPTVHRQKIIIADPTTYANVMGVTAAGNAQVAVNAALPAGTNKVGTVDIANAVAVAKGTQGANAIPTQSMVDSGRTRTNFQAVTVTPAAASTETLFTLTPVRAGVAGTAGTSMTVTSGKRLRLNNITVTLRNTAAAAAWCRFTLRCNPSGAAVATSPVEYVAEMGTVTASIGHVAVFTASFPDGLEFSGTEQLALTYNASLATPVIEAIITGVEY